MSNKWYEDEARKLEQIRKQVFDQHNTLEKRIDPDDIIHIIKSNLKFTPEKGQLLTAYIEQLKVYVKFQDQTNINTHINGPKGAWWTHKNPAGCFCCNDLNLIHVMQTILNSLAIQYPDTRF